MSSKQQLIEQIIQAWHELQRQTPLVQCMTNSVANNYVANILLAAGASPAMIDNPFEAESFTQISSALSINIGTPTTEQTQAMLISAQTAQQHQVPWVLDPVGYGAVLKWRSETVDQLLHFKPSIIRGNASEISTLAGSQAQSKVLTALWIVRMSTLRQKTCYSTLNVLQFQVNRTTSFPDSLMP